MKSLLPLVAALSCALFSGACATRSISNTAMPWGNQNTTYRGELSEFDVVGTSVGTSSSQSPGVRLQPGDRILLLQSGAMFPDQALVDELAKTFQVSTASGIPSGWTEGGVGLAGAAQRGGYAAVISCWGTLESGSNATEGIAAAWIPIVGLFVPSENLRMRIRLRFVVVDTMTRNWIYVTPDPKEDERVSSLAGKSRIDADQVEALRRASCGPAAAAIRTAVGIEGR